MFADKNIEITVAGVNPEKNDFAKANGTDFTVQWKRQIDSPKEFAAETAETSRNGTYLFDATIDFVGSNTTFKAAYRSIRPSGT